MSRWKLSKNSNLKLMQFCFRDRVWSLKPRTSEKNMCLCNVFVRCACTTQRCSCTVRISNRLLKLLLISVHDGLTIKTNLF